MENSINNSAAPATLKMTSVKITAVGDGIVGKTCMLSTYTTGEFPIEYVPTVFEHYGQNITVDGIDYNVTLWDTAGQEDYERLRPLSYPHFIDYISDQPLVDFGHQFWILLYRRGYRHRSDDIYIQSAYEYLFKKTTLHYGVWDSYEHNKLYSKYLCSPERLLSICIRSYLAENKDVLYFLLSEKTNCFLVCFSVDKNLASYDNVAIKWVPEVRHFSPHVPIILVATKTDLRDDPSIACYTPEDGRRLKRKVKAQGYLECSALRCQGLDEIFVEAIRVFLRYKNKKPKEKQCMIL